MKNKSIFYINKPNKILNDNSTIRDYIHVNDICKIILKSIYLKKKILVINCGTGHKVSTLDVLKRMQLIFKKNLKIKFKSPRKQKQPYPGLFKEEKFDKFNPNTCDLGNNTFYNHTQQQVKNLKSDWCCRPGPYQKEAQSARVHTQQQMNSCKQ